MPQGKIVPARGPTNFGRLELVSQSLDPSKGHEDSYLVDSISSLRLGSDLRVRGRNVRRDGQGEEEPHISSRSGAREVEGLVGDAGVVEQSMKVQPLRLSA